MSAPGFWEIAALAVLALIIFGPERLPGVAHSVGKTIGQLKREASSTLNELKAAADLEDMRGVADDLKGVTKDLKRSASMAGPVASSARAEHDRGERRATVAAGAADQPPPFDPDAT